jgi:hypothetical protein
VDLPPIALVHSPLTGPQAWGALPDSLQARGHDVVVVAVRDDEHPPYATRFVARAAQDLAAADITGPLVLVGHSGAGYLLPQIGSARRAGRRNVGGYVFLDAGIPRGLGTTRLSLMHVEDERAAREVEAVLRAGGRFPSWTDEDLRDLVPDPRRRAELVGSLRPRALDFFTEALPFPGDWPDAPCGYLQLTAAYDGAARLARSRGWPVVSASLPGGHFATCVDPDGVADLLFELLPLL